jgi:hypothetical protein
MTQLIESVLVVLIGFALKLLLAQIGVEIDEVLFNTIVAGIVVWILRVLGLELTFRAVAGVRRAFSKAK